MCVLLLITLLAFSPSFQNEFVNWDDNYYITENPYVQDFSPTNIKKMFTSFMVGNYHPLTMLSLSFNHAVSGNHPFSYQLVNILLHLLNVFLVFYFIQLMSKGKTWIALVTAFFFAIHPLHVESVSWISGRKDVLYTAFFLGALIAYYRYLQSKKSTLLIAVVFWFLLSALSKPSAIVLPVVLLLLDYWYGREWEIKWLIEKIPAFIIAILFGILTLKAQQTAIEAFDYSIIEKTMFGAYALLLYFIKAFVPFSLSCFHPYPLTTTASSLPLIYKIAPLLVIALLGLLFYTGRKSKVIVFGLLFFLINIVLVLQFITVSQTIIAERYTYLPYVGLYFILAYGLYFLMADKKWNFRFVSLFVLLAGLLFTYMTFQQCRVWKDSKTLWTKAIETYPKTAAQAYYNRGLIYLEEQKLPQALSDFSKAINIKPDYVLAYNGRANVYQRGNDFLKAYKDYSSALQQGKNEYITLNNRGKLHFAAGKHQEALQDFSAAIKVKPAAANSYNNRGNVYFKRQEYDKAIEAYQKALSIQAHNFLAQANLGAAYLQQQKYEPALAHLNRAIELNPNYGQAYINRANLYTQQKKYKEALQDIQQYIKRFPKDAQGYFAAGQIHQTQENFEDAVSFFNQAIGLSKNNGSYYLYRSYAHARLNQKEQAKTDAQKAIQLGEQVDKDYWESLQ